MNAASTPVELSLIDDDATHLEPEIRYVTDYEQSESGHCDPAYTAEPEFDPEFDIAMLAAQCKDPGRQISTRIAGRTEIPAMRDLLPLPRSRDEALAAVRYTLSNLAVEMRSASAMPQREAPITLPSGVASLDSVIGGLPRGALTEVYGPASSGRTSLLIAALAEATARGEVCALIDTTDCFCPHSAASAGVDLSRLLWARCNGTQPVRETNAPRFTANDFGGHDLVSRKTFTPRADKLARSTAFRRLEQALKIADLLIQAGGFGLIALDTASLPQEVARRVPLTSWFRFRRAVEHTPTVLLAIEQEPFAHSCASLVLRLERLRAEHSSANTFGCSNVSADENKTAGAPSLSRSDRVGVTNAPSFSTLLQALEITVEVERAPFQVSRASFGAKKPPRSATAQFRSATEEQFLRAVLSS